MLFPYAYIHLHSYPYWRQGLRNARWSYTAFSRALTPYNLLNLFYRLPASVRAIPAISRSSLRVVCLRLSCHPPNYSKVQNVTRSRHRLTIKFFGYINSIQNLIRIYDYHWKYIYAVAPAPLLDRHVYNFSRSIVLDSAGTFWASLILTPADFRIIIDVTCHWQWCHWLKSTGSACLNLHKRQGGSYIRLKGVEDINLRVRSPLLSTAYFAHQYPSIVKVLPA